MKTLVRLAGLLMGLQASGLALADSASSGAGSLPRRASANLDFTVSIGKLLFLRVGDAAWPTASSSVSTVTFQLTPSTPAATATGNRQSINWSGAAPTFAVTPSGNALPVQVVSNAGPVSLQASSTALTSTSSSSNTIPSSEILLSSSDGGLPAPLVPNAGSTGTRVNVTPTAFGNLVTNRTATWTFTYANSAPRPAGTYTGTVSFTASTP